MSMQNGDKTSGSSQGTEHSVRCSVQYVVLEHNALSAGLGGKTHVEGVVRALSDRCDVTVVAHDTSRADFGVAAVALAEIPYRGSPAAFQLRMLVHVVRSSGADVFLYRKTLFGLVLLSFLVRILRFFGRRERHFVELNGISGDFRDLSWTMSRALLYLNAALLRPFDGVYCVNRNIADRILSTGLLRRDSVFVGENGSFGPQLGARESSVGVGMMDGIHLVFWGADQPHYALPDLVMAVRLHNEISGRAPVVLHLVGPGFARFADTNIIVVGGLDRARFVARIGALRGRVWGVLPLRHLHGRRDVRPIKLLDYASCGMPVLSTYIPEDLEERVPGAVVQFESGSANSLAGALLRIAAIHGTPYLALRSQLFAYAEDRDWKHTLEPLVSRVCGVGR